MGSFNEKVGLLITKATGTMWTAYLFCALALVSLPAAIASHSALVIISWIAQTFLQLVLLPIIMVGQSVAEKHHATTHAKLEEIHKTLKNL